MLSFKEFEEKAWEKKAHLFDDTWGQVTRQPNKRIIEMLGLVSGQSLLDIGCGSGHFSELADRHGIRVTGIDYSEAMIKIAKESYPKIAFQREDAESLTFNDETFEATTLNYLLLHVTDQKKALLEARRVLKNGGKLLYTLWLPPSESPALELIFSAIGKYADTSVIPLADDIFQFVNEAFCGQFFLESGLFLSKRERFEGYFDIRDKEDFFSSVLAGTRMGGTIDLQKPDIKNRIKEEIFSSMDQYKAGARYIIPAPSVITLLSKSA